jgi:hypothetical protein
MKILQIVCFMFKDAFLTNLTITNNHAIYYTGAWSKFHRLVFVNYLLYPTNNCSISFYTISVVFVRKSEYQLTIFIIYICYERIWKIEKYYQII